MTSFAGGLPAGAALLVLTATSNAEAVVLYEAPLEGDSLSAGASVRSYNLLARGGPLTTVGPASDQAASVTLLALRPQLELKTAFGLDLVTHDELSSMTSSLNSALLGGTLSLGQGARPPVWLPLDWAVVSNDRYQLRDRIDWMYVRYSAGPLAFSLGRQPITFGRGRIWTPEDLIAPFSPLQIDTEYKPGADAARLSWSPSDSVTVLVVGAAAAHHDSALLGRTEVALGPLRVGVMAGSVRSDVVAGLDLFLDLGKGTELHGEATLTWVTDADRRPWGRRGFDRAVLGTSSELSHELHLVAEGYFNGAGARNAADYLAELSSRRVAIGESYAAGRLYGGVAVDWEAHPLIHGELSLLSNLEDPSAIIAPTLHYNVAQNASLLAGAYLPAGRAPAYSTRVTPRSEFGLYPQFYHVDAKLWF